MNAETYVPWWTIPTFNVLQEIYCNADWVLHHTKEYETGHMDQLQLPYCAWYTQIKCDAVIVCRCAETTAQTDRPGGTEPQRSYLPRSRETPRYREKHWHPPALDDRRNLLHPQQEEVRTDARPGGQHDDCQNQEREYICYMFCFIVA